MGRVPAHASLTQCGTYLDDLLNHTTDFDGVLNNLWTVFTAIWKAHLPLPTGSRSERCGYGSRAREDRCGQRPRSVVQLCSLLGLTSYHRRLVRDFANVTNPLTEKGLSFEWTGDFTATFNHPRTALREAQDADVP